MVNSKDDKSRIRGTSGGRTGGRTGGKSATKNAEARGALAGAFARHHDALRRFISRLVIKPEDIDDILQDTFLNAFSVKDPGAIKSPKFYLYTVARHTAYRELKRRKAAITESIDEAIENNDEPIAFEAQVDDAVQAKMRFAALGEVVESLPPQCRRVFLLRKVFGYSHKEISQAMGISISTVEKHLGRAMCQCMHDPRLSAYQQAPQTDDEPATVSTKTMKE